MIGKAEINAGYRRVDDGMEHFEKEWTGYVNELTRVKWNLSWEEQVEFDKTLEALHQWVDKANDNRKARKAKEKADEQAKWDKAHVTVTD